MLNSSQRLFVWARHGRPSTLTPFGMLAHQWRPLISGAQRRGVQRRKKRDLMEVIKRKPAWTPWLWTS